MKKWTRKILAILLGATVVALSLVYSKTAIAAPEELNYLSSQLEELIKATAPHNQGLKDYILPESTDLANIPADPRNPLTPAKIHLGQLLFHETALSLFPINPKHWQQASCATCHFAQAGFRSNLRQALGTGGLGWNQDRHRDPQASANEIDKQDILAPSILNSAYQEAKLWNGRLGVTGSNSQEGLIQVTDVNRLQLQGLETQAIEGLTIHKLGTAAIAEIPEYQALFAQAFADAPPLGATVEDKIRAGKAIAAYERTVLANRAPFQQWLKGDKQAMSVQQLRGAKIFFSSTCVQCHNGPNLAKEGFFAVGFGEHPQNFGGLSLGRSEITRKTKDDFKFKVPQLYNLADSSPYGHGGTFATLKDVVTYFNQGEAENLAAKYSGNLSPFFRPLHLTQSQVNDLTAFLATGLQDPDLMRYVPEKIPSGLCFPNNDPASRSALRCD